MKTKEELAEHVTMMVLIALEARIRLHEATKHGIGDMEKIKKLQEESVIKLTETIYTMVTILVEG